MYSVEGELILASSSPRRQQMLREAGIPFTVSISAIDETQLPNETPEALVRRLALSKAETVAQKFPACWVLGADTDVDLNGTVIGKPASVEDAQRILRDMQNRTHTVWGAFSFVHLLRKVRFVESHASTVRMAAMTEDQIRRYVATGEPMDKAGAYAMQGIGGQFVEEVHGSVSNVIGLNLHAMFEAGLHLGVFR